MMGRGYVWIVYGQLEWSGLECIIGCCGNTAKLAVILLRPDLILSGDGWVFDALERLVLLRCNTRKKDQRSGKRRMTQKSCVENLEDNSDFVVADNKVTVILEIFVSDYF